MPSSSLLGPAVVAAVAAAAAAFGVDRVRVGVDESRADLLGCGAVADDPGELVGRVEDLLGQHVAAFGVRAFAGARLRGNKQPVSRFAEQRQDRKSTRLNSSHTVISYAVF